MSALLAEMDHGQQLPLGDAVMPLRFAKHPAAIFNYPLFSIKGLGYDGSDAHVRSVGVQGEGLFGVRVGGWGWGWRVV